MNEHVREFHVKRAVREHVPLLVGLMGCSGSGKTFSALRLATGIKEITGGEIFGIDTEARRMLHYADRFKFEYVQFGAPFGSLDYLAALEQCVKAGAGVIIVDSMSHEHESPGGMLDFQEKELDRLGGSDWQKRERVKMLAWQKPKAARRRLINGILQLNANFIFCFRAREKMKPLKISGKTEVVPMGFMPIAGEEFLFEQTINCLLLPNSGGTPTWQSENIGEQQMMKLPIQFRDIFAANKPLDEEIGRALATWARGEPPKVAETVLDALARGAASHGRDAFNEFYKGRSREEQAKLRLMKADLEKLFPQDSSPHTLEQTATDTGASGDDSSPNPEASETSLEVDMIAIASQRGTDAANSGMSRKAVPPEYRKPERKAEADAWFHGWDSMKVA